MTALSFSAKTHQGADLHTSQGLEQGNAPTELPPVSSGLVDTLFKLASGQTAADCAA